MHSKDEEVKQQQSKTEEKASFGFGKSFDYENLLKYLRQLRIEETENVEKEKRHAEAMLKSEARPQNFLFEKEYIKGKGMRNGGYGGLIVGKHYEKKQQGFDMAAEQARNQKWLQEHLRRQNLRRQNVAITETARVDLEANLRYKKMNEERAEAVRQVQR